MYQINDQLIYKREVCVVKNILPKYINDIDYYILSGIQDESLTIKIPTNNKYLKPIMTKKEAETLIEKIKTIEPIKTDSKVMESIYKDLLYSNDHEKLIKIIKTTYLRNKERLDNNKKITDKDTYYYNLAEKYLYQELAVSLGLTYDEAREYVIKRVSEA